jgi:predicted nucleic acid-binding protein
MMDWVLEGQVQVVTSPWVVGEYREVVRRVKFRRYGFPPHWLEFLIEESLRLPDAEAWPHPGPDLKDLPFLALARASGAWLVTGNLKHFPQPIRKGVAVLSPAEYLAQLTGASNPLA